MNCVTRIIAFRVWIASHNKDHAVVMNTIGYVNEGVETDADFIELLKTIAGQNGGRFRLVPRRTLLSQPPLMRHRPVRNTLPKYSSCPRIPVVLGPTGQ